MRVAYIDSIER